MRWLAFLIASTFVFACGQRSNKNIFLIDVDLPAELSRWLAVRDNAEASADVLGFANAQLQINYLVELSEAHQSESSAEIEQVHGKYRILAKLFRDEADTYQKTRATQRTGESPSATASFLNHTQRDVYSGPSFSAVYHPDSLAQVRRVMKDFGELYVKESPKRRQRYIASSVVSKRRPWSGYWYPFENQSLYHGSDAPLAKLDRLYAALGFDTHIAEEESQFHQGFRPDAWEGMCDAWSAAAVLNSEPKSTKTITGRDFSIDFSIADQKALLTFSHLRVNKRVYGVQYAGDYRTDGTYQDIKPEAFHKIVTAVVGEERRALVVDDVAGIQVWNKPLYAYRWHIEQDPNRDHIFNVKGYARFIVQRRQESEKLTSSNDYLVRNYEYRLYVDKSVGNSEGYRVIAGQWVNESFADHPDTVTYFPKTKRGLRQLGSHNGEFNKYLNRFRKLFWR